MSGNSDNLKDDKYRFFKPSPEFTKDIKAYNHVLQCLQEDVELMGDYNSEAGKQLVISFKVCKGKPVCRDEAEIKKWMRRKFILIMENQIDFNK